MLTRRLAPAEFGVVGLLLFGVVGLLTDPERKSGNLCGETVRFSDNKCKNHQLAYTCIHN